VGGAGLAVQALTSRILELVQQRLQAGLDLNVKAVAEEPQANAFTVEAFRQALQHLAQMEDAEQLADLVSATLLRDVHHRQVILETPGLEERLRHLVHFLQLQGGLEEPDSPTEP
jgi:ATP-dependent Lon protease